MGYRGRIYFTEKQKAEIWDRWQRGESMSSIGRRGIVTLSGIGPVWTINQQAKSLKSALSEQNSKYLERPSNRSDRSGKMQENQWPRNPVLTFWQSKRICSDNAASRRWRERPLWVISGSQTHPRACLLSATS
jgi:hypothetical protein